MRKQLPLITGIILLLLGMALAWSRSLVLSIPMAPDRTASTWEVELTVRTEANESAASLSIYNPSAKNVFRIVDRAFSSDDYSISFAQVDNRSISMFSKKNPGSGNQRFSARLKIEKDPHFYTRRFSKRFGIEFSESEQRTLRALENKFKEQYSGVKLTKRVVDAVMTAEGPEFEFLFNRASKLAALEFLDISARVYFGFELREGKKIDSLSTFLVVIRTGTTYLYSTRDSRFVPRSKVLLWGTSRDPIASVEGLRILDWNFTAVPIKAHVPKGSNGANSWLAQLFKWTSVTKLPLATQHSFAGMLLLPLAALLIATLRNIVGIKTFGTFMPAIIALSFRETGLLLGLFLLFLVVFTGVLLRTSFKYFRLLLVPRLCATLTCVVMLLFLLSVIGANLRLHSLGSLSLFPVVILAMVIERLSIAIDEFGLKFALNTLLMSLLAATLAYLLISIQQVFYLFTAFPELNLSVLGASILLGRYFGYRITELVRFKSFAEQGA